MIWCCKDCVAPERYPGCHDHCIKYAKEKAKHNAEKAKADEKKRIDGGLLSQTLVGVEKAYKAQRKLKVR